MVKTDLFFVFLAGQEEAQTSLVDKGILNDFHFLDYCILIWEIFLSIFWGIKFLC